MEEIARAVGINKALIYRVFASKEELFVLTVTLYLDELRESSPRSTSRTSRRSAEALDRYTRFCLRYPAFLDCALSLMRRPAEELRERVGEGTWLRLGASMSACLAPLARSSPTQRRVEDPDFTANRLYTQVLGTMHLARIGLGVDEAAPGVPGAFPLEPEAVRRACVADGLALASPLLVLGRRLDHVALQLPVLAVELHDLHGLDRVAVVLAARRSP